MADIYINADTGNDTTGDGSSSLPWLTLSKAVTESTTGDTIKCETATASYTLASQNFGTKTLTIEGVDKPAWQAGGTWAGAIFDGSSGSVAWSTFDDNSAIRNLVFKDTTQASNTAFISCLTSEGMSIETCVFKDIDTNDTGTYQGGIIGFPPALASANVIGCIFYSTTGNSMEVLAGRNNTGNAGTFNFHNNVVDTAGVSAPRIFVTRSEDLNINASNNIFYRGTGDTSSVFWTSVSQTINFNTWTNNCIYDAGQFTNEPTGTGQVETDPLFCDRANRDYRLRPDSPCVGTGTII